MIISAEILSEFFWKVFTWESDGEIPFLPPVEVQQKMPEMTITENAVVRLLNKIKIDKFSGPDGMYPRYLSEIALAIAKPQKSLEERTILVGGKKTRVNAICKKGRKSNPGNLQTCQPDFNIMQDHGKLVTGTHHKFMQEHIQLK